MGCVIEPVFLDPDFHSHELANIQKYYFFLVQSVLFSLLSSISLRHCFFLVPFILLFIDFFLFLLLASSPNSCRLSFFLFFAAEFLSTPFHHSPLLPPLYNFFFPCYPEADVVFFFSFPCTIFFIPNFSLQNFFSTPFLLGLSFFLSFTLFHFLLIVFFFLFLSLLYYRFLDFLIFLYPFSFSNLYLSIVSSSLDFSRRPFPHFFALFFFFIFLVHPPSFPSNCFPILYYISVIPYSYIFSPFYFSSHPFLFIHPSFILSASLPSCHLCSYSVLLFVFASFLLFLGYPFFFLLHL